MQPGAETTMQRLARRMSRTKSVEQIMRESRDAAAAAAGGEGGGGLKKCLTVVDLIAYGLGSTLGGGIFVTVGVAAQSAGPAVALSFLLASFCCMLSAFCYAEFAARLPVSGSAYTFAYTSMGEATAWFIGWNLTLEYAISAAAVARGWAEYVVALLRIAGALPTYSAPAGACVQGACAIGTKIASACTGDADCPYVEPFSVTYWINDISLHGGTTFQTASPLTVLIIMLCTVVLLAGVKESATFNLVITCINVTIIGFIIIVGGMHVDTSLWTLSGSIVDSVTGAITRFSGFAPAGANGIVAASGIVFFAFIGFDAVSTLAEEVKNPQRDLPAGILGTLGIASALYVAVSLVVAGLVPTYGCGSNANAANGTNSSGRNASDFSSLAAPWWGPANGSNSSGGGPGFGACPAGNGVPFCITTTAPLADAFTCLGLSVPATTVAVGAVTCLTATTLCSLFGQPRIFLAMANDGLLFPKFKTMTSKSQVPWFGTLVTGVVSSALGFVLNLDTLTNMISIGTLMAFTVVCMSVIVLRKRSDARPSQIYWLLAAWTAVSIAWGVAANATVCPPTGGVCTPQVYMPVFIPASCILAVIVVAMAMLPSNAVPGTYVCPLVPFLPALGVLTNIYLICGLDSASVYRIIVWTIVGMSIYFFYGMSHSTLETMQLPSSSETQRVPLLFGDAAGVASPPGVAIVQVQQHAGQPLTLSATGRA